MNFPLFSKIFSSNSSFSKPQGLQERSVDAAQRIKISDLQESNRLVSDDSVQIYHIGEQKVAKLCNPLQLSEAEAMRYVRQKTSLPVPEI